MAPQPKFGFSPALADDIHDLSAGPDDPLTDEQRRLWVGMAMGARERNTVQEENVAIDSFGIACSLYGIPEPNEDVLRKLIRA